MGSQNHYSLLPNDTAQQSFRLLELEPGQSEDQVICELRTVSLPASESAQCPFSYEAVSHVWGSKKTFFPIRVGAWPVPVRENLYHFLKQVRDPNKRMTLWIDALCINQANYDERALQVQFMDKIYKGARRALVWLGKEDTDVGLAMDVIEQIANTPASAAHITQKQYEALLSWAERSYWTRTWVVQEFLLARDVVVILGNRRLDWSTLSKFMRHVQIEAFHNSWWQQFVRSPAHTLMRQRTLEGRPEAPLARLLVYNQHTQCEEPRDRVYAMLGLALPAEHEELIRPSYRKDLRRLIFDVLNYCRIPSKDVVRHVEFLFNLLAIAKDKNASTSLGREFEGSRGNSLEVTGFPTGTIVYWNIYDESFKPSEAFANDPQNERQMLKELRHYSFDNVSRMLRDLEQSDLHRLQSSYAALQSLHNRAECSKTTNLAVILTSECDKPEVLLGLIVGNVKKGDRIVCFLGHPFGLVVDPAKPEIGSAPVKGVIVCARPDEKMIVRDTVTRQISKYWTVQTEAELATPAFREHFQLSQKDLLNYAR